MFQIYASNLEITRLCRLNKVIGLDSTAYEYYRTDKTGMD